MLQNKCILTEENNDAVLSCGLASSSLPVKVANYPIWSVSDVRIVKLKEANCNQIEKWEVFMRWGFFENMFDQNEIYLPSRVQSKHICQVTLWIEDINLIPQC